MRYYYVSPRQNGGNRKILPITPNTTENNTSAAQCQRHRKPQSALASWEFVLTPLGERVDESALDVAAEEPFRPWHRIPPGTFLGPMPK